MFSYKTHGTCSVSIDLEIDENNKITHCQFHRGCKGNTSCPDQLSRAIEAWEQKNQPAAAQA